MEMIENIDGSREHSYFRALESAYNVIFEINKENNTVKCIHGRKTSDIGSLSDIHMTIDSAKLFWVENYIVEEDRDMMRDYLNRISDSTIFNEEHRPLQAEFRFHWIDQVTYHFLSVAIPLDANSILLCIRDVSRVKYSGMLAREGIALQNLHHFLEDYVLHEKSALGILLLREESDKMSILFASQKIREYWGLTHNSYLYYSAEECPKSDFLNFSSISQEDYENLKKTGHMDMTIKDMAEANENKRVSVHLKRFDWQKNILEIVIYDTLPSAISDVPRKGIYARTFGHFDLFFDGTPVVFSNAKEKELLALLIDRNGGTLTSSEAIGILWEDALIDEKAKARYRKLAMGLKNTLRKHGIEDIIINRRGVRSIDAAAITCDYYELIKGNPAYRGTFHNSYMTDYSWSESTLASLWDYS